MNLIDRDKVEIPRQRERLLDGLIFVPLADVVAALDAAHVVFDGADLATVAEALDRQVRKPLEWEEIEDRGEDKRTWCKVCARCPSCGAEQKRRRAYCPDCGQALDWKEDGK